MVGTLAAALVVLSVKWAVNTVATAAQTVKTVAQTVATVAGTVATTAFGVAMTLATGPIGLVVLAIAGLVAGVILLSKNWETIWPAIQATFKAVVDRIVGIYDSGFAWLLPGGVFIKGLLFILRNWRSIWEAVQDVLRGAVNGIISSINAIIRAWNSISFDVPSVSIPFVGDFGGFSVGVGQISEIALLKKRIQATGGDLDEFANGVQNYRGGMALVGERGPELVNLPRGADVIPNGRGGPTMTTVVNMNFYGDIYGDDFDRRVNEARLRWERRGNA